MKAATAADGGYLRETDGEEKLTEAFTVRFTDAQMRALRKAANGEGVSPNAFLRNLVVRVLPVGK